MRPSFHSKVGILQRDVVVVGIELARFQKVGFGALQIVVGHLQRRAHAQELGLCRALHIQLVDFLFRRRQFLVRGLVIAAFAVKFGEIQPQLNGIKLSFGNAACRQCSDSGFVFRDSISLTIFFLRQQRLMACSR